MIFQADNAVFWVIICTGLFAYSLIFDALFSRHQSQWCHTIQPRLNIIEVCLAVLPLLGLLGTIMGLLQTFADMAMQHVDFNSMIAGGVGTALGTTQLGLLLAVPGLLMHRYLHRNAEKLQAQSRYVSEAVY